MVFILLLIYFSPPSTVFFLDFLLLVFSCGLKGRQRPPGAVRRRVTQLADPKLALALAPCRGFPVPVQVTAPAQAAGR